MFLTLTLLLLLLTSVIWIPLLIVAMMFLWVFLIWAVGGRITIKEKGVKTGVIRWFTYKEINNA
jgi:hypothetical protein